MRKGSKKGPRKDKKEESSKGKKYLIYVESFRCHRKEDSTNECQKLLDLVARRYFYIGGTQHVEVI
jgi:hypothetical protein